MKLSSLYTSSNLPYVRLSDTKSSGTAGTSYASGGYRTVTINTEEQDADGLCSLSSNQFTLSAGAYAVKVSPRFIAASFTAAIRIRNTDDNTTPIKWPAYVQGSAAGTGGSLNPIEAPSFEGRFSIGASKALELQIFPSTTVSQAALTDGENEVYWVVELVKLD